MTRVETATLGGGCFWCLEAVYEQVEGVTKVVSGYAGGHVENPTYEEVCGKRTGHAEVVQVTYDPARVTYRDLLDIFFSIHDPTTPDRQGHDVGPQYRSIVFTHSSEQEATVREAIREFDAKGLWDAPIVTQVEPLTRFYPAEDYHQGYFRNNPTQGYCRMVVAPKVAKFRSTWASRLRGPAA